MKNHYSSIGQLNKNLEKLLQKALKDLPINYRDLIHRHLVSLARRHEWFHHYLVTTLKHGMTFASVEKDALAAFYPPTNQLVFNLNIFSLPKKILQDILTIILRHEITHAYDEIFRMGNEDARMQINKNFLQYQRLANTLYNQISCIKCLIKLKEAK